MDNLKSQYLLLTLCSFFNLPKFNVCHSCFRSLVQNVFNVFILLYLKTSSSTLICNQKLLDNVLSPSCNKYSKMYFSKTSFLRTFDWCECTHYCDINYASFLNCELLCFITLIMFIGRDFFVIKVSKVFKISLKIKRLIE